MGTPALVRVLVLSLALAFSCGSAEAQGPPPAQVLGQVAKEKVAEAERRHGPDSPGLADELMAIGYALMRARQPREAEALFRRALSIREKRLPPDHQALAEAASAVGMSLGPERFDEAEPFMARSLAIMEKSMGPGAAPITRGYLMLGTLAYGKKQFTRAEAHFRRALASAEAGGRNDMDTGRALDGMSATLCGQKRFEECEPFAARLVEIQERRPGGPDPNIEETRLVLAIARRETQRAAEAEPMLRRYLAYKERTLGPDDPGVAGALNQLGLAEEALGKFALAEASHRRAALIVEKAVGPEHKDTLTLRARVAVMLSKLGRFDEAEEMQRRVVGGLEKALGREHPDLALPLDQLAQILMERGRYEEAEPLLERVLAIAEKSANGAAIAGVLNSLASLGQQRGQYARAERLYVRALENAESSLGRESLQTAVALANLGTLYNRQGRHAEAEALLRRSLSVREKRLGGEHRSVATAMHNLSGVHEARGEHAAAQALLQRSLEILEKSLGPDHPTVAASLVLVGKNQRDQGRFGEAEASLRRSLAIRERTLGPDHPETAETAWMLGEVYRHLGRLDDSDALLGRSAATYRRAIGEGHPHVAAMDTSIAVLRANQGRWQEALDLTRGAVKVLADRFTHGDESARPAMLSEQRSYAGLFELHLSMLHRVRDDGSRTLAESFEVAQLARTSDTAEQVARMAARHAAGDDAVARLARRRQDAIGAMIEAEGRVIRFVAQGGGESPLATLKRKRDDAGRDLQEIDRRIAGEYPRYFELISPRPLGVADAQTLLLPEEALVVLHVGASERFVWAFRRDRARFDRVAIRRGEVDALVRKLRAQLDLGGDIQGILRRPFDPAPARELYSRLFAPVAEVFANARHLIVVPDGALTSLPPGVLVMESEGAATAWLGERYALSVLPSPASLRALRAFGGRARGPEPFMGFGDPDLDRSPDGRRGAELAPLYRRGYVADPRDVRRLAALPESADELRAIAAMLKAAPESVRLRAAATERAVKTAELGRYRTIAFATHALMAGDFKGLGEPALVLTPPPEGTDVDDGLLTASEVSQLRLDADWVILSACNTAAPDGKPGAEGLSGLARAFFHAGSRSLLVSHWAVSSEAAVALTTRMFEEIARGASKAEALRLSMESLRKSTADPRFAHPAFWAPFVIVGEGAARP